MRKLALITTMTVALTVAGAACSSDDSSAPTTTTANSSTTSQPSSTVPSSTTIAPTTTSVVAPSELAVWPFESGERYDDPLEAARTFAVDYLAYTKPVLGEYQAGDSRSGEIEVRARATSGAFTTVLVRKLSDDSWWVIGAVSGDIVPASPEADAVVTSPVTLSGKSRAFEANINVEIRAAGSVDALTTGFVMGGGMEDLGPYSKAFAFDAGIAPRGFIVMRVLSMEDGGAESATIIPVRFK